MPALPLLPVVVIASGLLLMAAGGVVLGLRSWRLRARAAAGDRLRLVVAENAPPREEAPGMLAALGRVLVLGPSERRYLAGLLHGAGFHRPQALGVFALVRAVLTLLAPLAAWLALGRDHGPLLAVAAPTAAAVAAWLLPRWFLGSRATRRQAKARNEMAFLADLMVLVLESGVSMDQCLRYATRASAKAAPIVHYGLTILIDDLDKGMGYDEALARWGDRLGIPEGRELAGVFRHSLVYGIELAPALRTFIRDWSERRINDARTSIGRRSAALTVVMVGFFLPPLLILTVGPAVVSALSMKGGAP